MAQNTNSTSTRKLAGRRTLESLLPVYNPLSPEPHIISVLRIFLDAPGKYHRLKAMRELQKILGVYHSNAPKLPILLILLGQNLLNQLIQALQTAIGDRCCVQHSLSMRDVTSPNSHGMRRFGKLRLIIGQVSRRISAKDLHMILRLNQSDIINTDFNKPLEYLYSNAGIMLVSTGDKIDIPYDGEVEPHIFTIRFHSPEISPGRMMRLSNIIQSNHEIEKLSLWLQEGHRAFESEDISRSFLKLLQHRRRLRDDPLYRFYHKFIERTPGHHLLVSDFLQGLHLFLLQFDYDQIYEQDEVTSFLRKERHRKITHHARGKPNIFKYADMNFTAKFRSQYLERKSLKRLVEKRYDNLADMELI